MLSKVLVVVLRRLLRIASKVFGMAIAAITPKIAMATSNSIKLNPLLLIC